jgi:hypothetical protein
MRNRSEKYFPLIESYSTSGLSVKQFCEEHQLKECTYWYWKKKHQEQTKPSIKGFAPLLIEQKKSAAAVSIIYADGTRLVFENAVEASLLKQLLPAFIQ